MRIQGRLTKDSAVYRKGLVHALASAAFNSVMAWRRRAHDLASAGGVESPLVTVLKHSLEWQEERRWTWKRPVHVNLLEGAVVRNWLEGLVQRGIQGRFIGIEDSRVTMFSQAKGRSPSVALTPMLQMTAALQLGGRLYPAYHFIPSHFNIADDPTRYKDVRPAVRPLAQWIIQPGILQPLLE